MLASESEQVQVLASESERAKELMEMSLRDYRKRRELLPKPLQKVVE